MENNQTQSLSLLEKFNKWISESITVKLASIGILMLLLLIPSQWIIHLIEERQQRAVESKTEVYSKWSGKQLLAGPFLVIPFKANKTEYVEVNKTLVPKTISYTEYFYLVPELLNSTIHITPTTLHRGIYDVAVYESDLNHHVQFSIPDETKRNVKNKDLLWKDAFLVYSLSDQRGISEKPVIKNGNRELEAEPTQNLGIAFGNSVTDNGDVYYRESMETTLNQGGFKIPLQLTRAEDFNGSFSFTLKIKGSETLEFLPIAKTTTIKAEGEWASPSFIGEFLPANRNVGDSSFTADWKILHFKRALDDFWIGTDKKIDGGAFGVKLVIPADQYQKSIRTAKYGQLIILLTFLALFLVEVIRKTRIHPFQYLLIAAALIIYYSLLLSISEQLGFNIGYMVASLLTITLVSWYTKTFLPNRSLTYLFAGLMVFFYAFIFIIIIQQELSLLLGSIGLFLIIAMVMYLSRHIAWYKQNE